MNYRMFFFLLVFFPLLSFSNIVTGILKKGNKPFVNEKISIVTNSFGYTELNTEKTDKFGKFKFKFESYMSGVVSIKTSFSSLFFYMASHDSLYVELIIPTETEIQEYYNADEKFLRKFSGNNSQITQDLYEYSSFTGRHYGDLYGRMVENSKESIPIVNEIYRDACNKVDICTNNFLRSHSVSNEAKRLILYDSKWFKYSLNFAVDNDSFKILQDTLMPPVLESDEALGSTHFKDFLDYLFINYFTPKLNPHIKSKDSAYIEAIHYYSPSSMKNYLLVHYLAYQQGSRTLARNILVSDFCLKYIDQPNERRFVEYLVEKLKEKNKMYLASNYLKDVDKKGNESIEKLLYATIQKNKNKVIYIDFWGLGCSGCIKGLASSIELREKFKNEDVAFVYFATKGDEVAINQTIEKYQISNLNFMISIEQKESANIFLNLFGNPNYILIDRKGNIVNCAAKSPSDPLLINDIQALILEN